MNLGTREDNNPALAQGRRSLVVCACGVRAGLSLCVRVRCGSLLLCAWYTAAETRTATVHIGSILSKEDRCISLARARLQHGGGRLQQPRACTRALVVRHFLCRKKQYLSHKKTTLTLPQHFNTNCSRAAFRCTRRKPNRRFSEMCLRNWNCPTGKTPETQNYEALPAYEYTNTRRWR